MGKPEKIIIPKNLEKGGILDQMGGLEGRKTFDGSFPATNNPFVKQYPFARPRIFENANAMAQAFVAYTEHIDNPENWWVEEKPMIVDGTLQYAQIKHRMPYTLQGFAVFCGACSKFMYSFKTRCPPEFETVFGMIHDVMFAQKFSGAAAGFFNANIISRDLNLADHTENKNVNINANTTLTPEDAKAISEGLENEF